MKYMIKIIMGMAAVLLLLPSCTDELSDQQKANSQKISLSFSVAGGSVTRATEAEETKCEFALKTLDVFFFEQGGKQIFHQRLAPDEDLSNNKTATVYLSANKDDYQATAFTLYAIANSNQAETLEQINTLDELKKVVATNDFPENLGSGSSVSFLMDGKTDVGAGAIENIHVELERAAAKIVVKLQYGSETIDGNNYSYQKLGTVRKRIMHYATATSLLAEGKTLALSERVLKSPDDMVQNESAANEANRVVFYSYANDWNLTVDAPSWETLQGETYLLLDVPVRETVTDENGDPVGEPQAYVHNYYRIPLDYFSVEGTVEPAAALKRNHCYTITATLKSLGSSKVDEPIELTSVRYKVADWVGQLIDVSKDEAEFFEVNKTSYDFRNTAEDHSLEFESSSPIEKIEIVECWYINKMGDHCTIIKDDNVVEPKDYLNNSTTQEKFPGEEYRPTFDWDRTAKSGKIDIESPLLVNTPKYIKIRITNADKKSKEVTIVQYPVEYITPILCKYSYRDDFGGTTYRQRGEGGIVAARLDRSGNFWTYMDNMTPNGITGNFGSKVAMSPSKTRGWDWDIYYYHWGRSSVQLAANPDGNHNPNIYHVRLTSASPEYTLGVPEVDSQGYTVNNEENAKLVSPSFMIASQLGAVHTTAATYDWTFEAALDHCSRYVEVQEDENEQTIAEYRNWRLPTKAELMIIQEFQMDPQSAVTTVLGGEYYWGVDGANGYVLINGSVQWNPTPAIRCVRDVHVQEQTK